MKSLTRCRKELPGWILGSFYEQNAGVVACSLVQRVAGWTHEFARRTYLDPKVCKTMASENTTKRQKVHNFAYVGDPGICFQNMDSIGLDW